ncbi:MAG TPA: helix-turn-helix transcriptional regulator [Gemmataceae bacterium]|jgi:transcriptional regulator with XRE-family HTH domain|nr:helix-turn-helix transcriptional regulator [Gemmataceae bacterium]
MSKKHIDHAAIVKLFAARLRQRRIEAGLTQAELADRASVAANYISRLEAARIAPGIDTLQQLATALLTTTHDLLPLLDSAIVERGSKERARALVERLIERADEDFLQSLIPLVARLVEGS